MLRTKQGLLPMICGLMLIAGICNAQVNVSAKFVPRKGSKEKSAPDPTKLSDVVALEAKADSSAGVSRVTLEIDDKFQQEKKAPPYNFEWDTLAERDGPHTIGIVAYNANGQTGVKRMKVTVENKLSLGIDYYAEEALLAMRRGDEVTLEKSARKAYRISTAIPEAIRAMALLTGLQTDPNRGISMIDDRQSMIQKDDPVTIEIRNFLRLVRAARNPDLIAMLPDMRAGLLSAKQRAREVLDEVKQKTPDTSTDANALLTRGDTLWNLHRYTEALDSYERVGRLTTEAKLQRRLQMRIASTLLRLGRVKEAESIAQRLTVEESDLTAKAVLGAVLFAQRKYEEAGRTVETGAEKKNAACLTVGAMTDMILGARTRAYKRTGSTFKLMDGPENQYLALAVFAENGSKDNARKAFTVSIMNSPLSGATLAEYGFQAIAFNDSPDRFIMALNIFDLALSADPEDITAMAGRAVSLWGLGRLNGFHDYIDRLSKLDPLSPDLFVMLAAELNRDPAKAATVSEALQRATKLDPYNYKYKDVPKPEVLATRMMRTRRIIPLSPSLLDKADAPPPIEETTLE